MALADDVDDPMAGQKPFEPTEENRRTVEALAGYGVPAEDIGKVVGCSAPTLRKYFRLELDVGTIKANAKVAESLYKKALGDGSSSVTAAIFWLKTRARWKEEAADVNVNLQTDATDADRAKAMAVLLAKRNKKPPTPDE